MGYILVTPRKHGNAVVTWNTSRRVEGKSSPVREATYLGLLDASGTKLVKSADLKELSAPMLAGLEKKHLAVSDEAPAPRGRKAVLLRHLSINDLSCGRIETVGTYRVLRGIAESRGFLQSLQTVFREDGDALFALMCQRLDSRMQSYLFRDWAEGTPFDLVRLSMSPKVISSLLSRIENRRLDFAKSWYQSCGRPRELIEDSTHFCTWSQTGGGRECEEYGWDHHQEAGKRQINVMSLVERASGLPIMYRAYPGSINDIATFLETSDEMKVIDQDASLLFVSDCGYFSSLNMRLMRKGGHDFVMEAKWDTQTLAILQRKRQALKGIGEYVSHGQYTYRYEPCTYVLHDKTEGGRKAAIGGYIFYSELEAGQLRNSLVSAVLLWKKAFAKYDFDDAEQAQEWLDTSTNGWGKYLALRGAWPELSVETNHALVDASSERFGFHVAVTSVEGITAGELLETCHSRDPVEKLWRTMKSELDAKSLMTKIDTTTQGQIFIVWGAAVLHRLLASGLEEAELDLTMNEALLTLRKVRMLCVKDKAVAQTPPRKAKDIIVGLELEKQFPEYAEHLAVCVAERERQKRVESEAKHRGRPSKFRLKKKALTVKEMKREAVEQKQRDACPNQRRRGRPPKK